MPRYALTLMLASTLVLAFHTGHAQPPPFQLGNGADGPRGKPVEQAPGRQRESTPQRDDRIDARDPRHRTEQERVRDYDRYRFRPEESEAVRTWYQNHPRPRPGVAEGQRELPPGLQRRMERRGDLPPGWQRKVEAGQVLSQEQVRHGRRPADDLLSRLPEQPEGTILMETEDQVIRVLESTGEVLDVLGVGGILRRREAQ